jgi:hypothetical protein
LRQREGHDARFRTQTEWVAVAAKPTESLFDFARECGHGVCLRTNRADDSARGISSRGRL